jgi:TonB family protein
MPARKDRCAEHADGPAEGDVVARRRDGRLTSLALDAALLAAMLQAVLAAAPVGASIPPAAPLCVSGGLPFNGSETGEWLEAAGRSGGDTAGVVAEVARGSELLRHCNPPAGAAAFRQADELAGGGCGGCLLGAAFALAQLGALDLAVETNRAAIAKLGGDPLLGRAWGQLGTLLLLQRTPAAEAEAGDALAAAVEAGGSYRAMALSRLAALDLDRQHYAEAVASARRAIEADPQGEAGGAGRSVLCRARRAGYTDEAPERRAPAPATRQQPSAAAPERAEPRRIGDGVKPPSKIYGPAPQYTEVAREARLQGVVIVEAVIDAHGCIADEKVLKGLPMGLDQAALAAMQGWVFEPATRKGKPVDVYYTLSVNFKLDTSARGDPAADAKPLAPP